MRGRLVLTFAATGFWVVVWSCRGWLLGETGRFSAATGSPRHSESCRVFNDHSHILTYPYSYRQTYFLPTDSFSKLTTECVYCSLHAFRVHESSHIAICLDTECVLDRIYAFYGQLLVCCALSFVMPGLSFRRHARSDFLSSCPAPTGHLVHRLRFLRISLAIADLSLTPLRSNTLSPSAEKPDQRKITGGLPVYLTHSCTSGCWVLPGLAREPLLRLLRAGT